MAQKCRKQRDATKEKSSSYWWKKRLVTKLASRADRSRASEGVEAVNGDEIG